MAHAVAKDGTPQELGVCADGKSDDLQRGHFARDCKSSQDAAILSSWREGPEREGASKGGP